MIYHVLTEAENFSEHVGGAISRWVANVVRDDDESRVVCSRADESWRFPETRIVRIPAFNAYYHALRASCGRFPWGLRDVSARVAFARFAAILRPHDIVYVHNRPEFVSVFRALVAPSVRVVLHLHNSHLVTAPERVAAALKPDFTVFCSRFLEREALMRLPLLAPTAVITNGADKRLFYPREVSAVADPSAAPVILFVGRLVAEKGVHVFTDALRLLEQRGIRVTGRVIGCAEFGSNAATAYTEDLHRRAPANVEFLPYASGAALAAEFRRATIFCCPSVWNEPFGMVNVEAMASGLPVVATNVGGIGDIFSTGGALLVAPNDPGPIADALGVLAANESLRQKVAAAGHAVFLERFEWSIIRRRYREVVAAVSFAR